LGFPITSTSAMVSASGKDIVVRFQLFKMLMVPVISVATRKAIELPLRSARLMSKFVCCHRMEVPSKSGSTHTSSISSHLEKLARESSGCNL